MSAQNAELLTPAPFGHDSEDIDVGLRLLVENVLDYAILLLDVEAHIVTWNKGAELLKGYSAGEIIGRHFSIFFSPEDVEAGKPAHELREAEENGRFEDEGWRVRKDGSRFWANVVLTALHDATGRLRGFGKVTRDLTKRRETELEIRAINANLEQRISECTARLDAVNKELECFSDSVSHDLRAPLRTIDGFSRIVLEEFAAPLTDKGKDYLRRIRDNAQKMQRLVDHLLAYSRAGRRAIVKRSVEPDLIVRSCLAEMSKEQEGRQVEIIVGELCACQADSTLLNQVWTNLPSNALKFTSKRQAARIEIGCRTEPSSSANENGGAARDTGPKVVYFIKDNGAGFDMTYIDRLFGVFQRLHRADDYDGTGVGLAIVQRIVQRHGGRIWAEGQVDHGATFSFTLE